METTQFSFSVSITLLLKSKGERETLFSDAMRQPLGREAGHGVVCILRALDHKYFFSEDRSI